MVRLGWGALSALSFGDGPAPRGPIPLECLVTLPTPPAGCLDTPRNPRMASRSFGVRGAPAADHARIATVTLVASLHLFKV